MGVHDAGANHTLALIKDNVAWVFLIIIARYSVSPASDSAAETLSNTFSETPDVISSEDLYFPNPSPPASPSPVAVDFVS